LQSKTPHRDPRLTPAAQGVANPSWVQCNPQSGFTFSLCGFASGWARSGRKEGPPTAALLCVGTPVKPGFRRSRKCAQILKPHNVKLP
jgi:hypothetical protein